MSFAKSVLENEFEYGAPVDDMGVDDPRPRPAAKPRAPRITNKFNLPLPLVKAVENDKYHPGRSDYTTSQLSGTPARQLVLKRRHWADITEDVADRIYSLSGQSKHVVLERAAEFCDELQFLAEERFYVTREGKTIGGQIDLYDKNTKTLWDWKETSVYVAYNDLKPEWIAQGNINKLLLEENGYEVKTISNIALYRDWKKSQVGTKKDYPEHQVALFPIPIWTREETEKFIRERIRAFEGARKELPDCSEEERWKSADVYALQKKGNKRATKLFDTEQEAITHMEIFDIKGHEVLFRPGVNKRCQSYCVVSEFCEQYKKLKEQGDEPSGHFEAA